jgi:Family of unknown function (DUF5996)
LQAHHALQWLARAARAYVPAKPDDSHTNLGWDEPFDGLATHPLKDEIRLSLRLSDLTLALHDSENPSQIFALDGRTDGEVRDWLRAHVSAVGLDVEALDAPSPYQLQTHAVSLGEAYALSDLKDCYAELAAWFANANASLGHVRNQFIARRIEASPLRCWPHHFDLATLMVPEAADPEQAQSVNAGFSPGDEHYGEPYFYVSPWPYPEAAKLAPLPATGHWHTQHFTAAIAPASRIVAAGNPQSAAQAFLNEAIDAAIAALR